MLIYDILHKERIYEIVMNNLRSIGIKYRLKKSALKIEKLERNKNISKKIFKTPLSYQSLNVVGLSSGAIVHVPVFVSQASIFLEKHIAQEGLFRKAGSHIRQKELIARLDKGIPLGEKNHAIDVANCLKSFFRDLPEPLIPYVYHDLFLHCVMMKTHKVQALLLACILLPSHHLNTLAFVMEFLKKVSHYEKQNKMSIDNLAKVMAPNIMPLRETTMSAVQTRLELHLTVIKLLIENAENIGVLPDNIIQAITSETVGSTDNELDFSDSQLHGKLKKKKYRSGSLTRKPHLSASNLNLRMLHGLKKIVGKSSSPESIITNENHILNTNTTYTSSSSKFAKKRKVTERSELQTTKKKRITDKMDKSRKIRLSLDRFVSKSKHKTDSELCAFNSHTERRWSLANDSLALYEKRRPHSDGPSQLKSVLKENDSLNSEVHSSFNDVFTDANVNLSDDNSEQVLLKQSSNNNLNQWHDSFDPNSDQLHVTNKLYQADSIKSEEKDEIEEYVRIPKSEYEDIKNRVSAIESRISQEFGYINEARNESLLTHSVNNVQSEYEKTLEEAGIRNIITADHLAKKLGRELKIRKSGEHKVIRSPSARKIGNLRRRSQEKTSSKRVSRTASWHSSQGWQQKYKDQVDQQGIICVPKERSIVCTKLTKLTSSSNISSESFCSEETTARLDSLQKQLNALISHTTEHTRDSFSDEEFSTNDSIERNPIKLSVRRASSFHGHEFMNDSVYFNRKVKELKKTNSQQNVLSNDYQAKQSNTPQNWKETLVSWRDANDYFQSCTSVPQTGRASVAKLRTQNAGMVLAKARLFDENTTTTRKIYPNKAPKIQSMRESNSKNEETNEINLEALDSKTKRVIYSHKKINRSIRNNLHSPYTPLKNKENLVNMSSETDQKLEKNATKRSSQKFNQKLMNNELKVHKSFYTNEQVNVETAMPGSQKESVTPRTASTIKNTSETLEISNLNNYKSDSQMCKTPHIKRPLAVKTPKSGKSLVRKPAVETRRTPLKAIVHPESSKYQSPKCTLKTKNLRKHEY